VGEYHIGLAGDKNIQAADLDEQSVLFDSQNLYGSTHSH
jgi:hypothetical protein